MSEEQLVDLRSDTVTRPSEGMYQAMREAPVGDDVYGEDETVNRLEVAAAALLGKQAGLFLSSATQANLAAMLVHNARGEEILLGDCYHIFVSEAGGVSALGGIVMHPLATDDNGGLACEQVLAAIKEDDPHHPITRTLALENTVSGRVQNPAQHRALADAVRAQGLVVHLDGARIMNAAVALDIDACEVAQPFDSVMMCLSKGLGAPVGAVLCGSSEFIRRARRQRKQLGGGMRQSGVLAACGLYALENNVERLAEDHENARQLAAGLGEIDGLPVRQATNMVFIEPEAKDLEPLRQHMLEHRIEIGRQSPRIRLVTHLDIDAAGIDRAINAFHSYFR
ncbi:MAG: low-specificity L-threonine aldolase [Gammaproteobacteria bacterium]|nr:MAG: low-specificity L-threonine aldolase [Gammaproteobacteria bacterium]